MTAREMPCDAPALPASMRDQTRGYAWARDRVGESGGAVYRLFGRDSAPDLFLKHGRGPIADDVTDEMARLQWLRARLPVPRVVRFVRTDDEAWLLTTAMPGRTAYQVMEDDPAARGGVVDALAAFLRRWHAVPVDACPFNSDYAFRMRQARARIDAGLVEVDEFDDARAGWTAERVWAAMHALLPLSPDRAVTHGDYSLDNLLIVDGAVAGCIDVGRAGIADRYQDLAILGNCLGEFGSDLPARLFDRYGIGEPDRRRIDFHLMLDELF